MFLVPTQQSHHHTLARHCASLPRASERQFKNPSSEAKLGKLLIHSRNSMERSVNEYSQPGLPSPYPSVPGNNQSEASPADQASAAQYPSNQETRPASYSTSATPTSEYGAYPQSARSSSSFPEHSIRQYHPASNHNGSSAGMAQQPTTSPSMPPPDGRNHQPQQVKSDSDVPIDPSIAAPSPPYPHGQYSPYAPPPPPQDMSHSYPQGAPTGMYTQPRPDWGNYGHPAGQMPHPHSVPYSHPPTSAPPGRPTQYGVQQVYSFVPIPGAQQHKRPRRRYEEIERMYKCGWNGCEKAYGTLNHLNAHVTMQSHGQKRTPEEFKEIRKEWKARKKEEDQQRKAAEEQDRQRHAQSTAVAVQAQNGSADPQGAESGQPASSYSSRQLPPIAYGPQYPPSTGSVPPQPLTQYSNSGHIYADNYQPSPPYGGQGQQMYNQRD
ncbi:hypothetical protein GGR50DRAFT_672939 [Xylaria sp. CBS 124048]|nr:hypothetical protein GGR50DRAFT_672939 [Xylaria sp. CBS 124048]